MNADWQHFLSANGATFSDGVVTGFGSGPPDSADSADARWITDLSSLSVLTVAGADAGQFLHGQFTSDVQALLPGRACMSAWCTPQGRVISTFLLMRRTDSFRIALPAARTAAFLKRLKMFVLRAAVDITDDSERMNCIGAAAADGSLLSAAGLHAPADWSIRESGDAMLVGIPGTRSPRYLIAAPANRSQEIWTALSGPFRASGTQRWLTEDILTSLPLTAAAGGEQYLPQELGLEAIGALSYDKGCYPGQEIVARVHYRGRAKRALFHVSGNGTPPPPDSPLVNAARSEQPAGRIIGCAADGSRWHALAVVDIDAVEPQLRLAAQPDLELEILPAH